MFADTTVFKQFHRNDKQVDIKKVQAVFQISIDKTFLETYDKEKVAQRKQS